jgi:hypothetical protein
MSRVLTHSFAVVFAVACIAIASTIAWSHFVGSAGAPAYVTKADFDQAFVDAAAGRRESKPTMRDQVDDLARSTGGGTTINVNRDRKSNRVPVSGGTGAAAPVSTSNTTVVRKNLTSPEMANDTPTRKKGLETDDAVPSAKRIHATHCEPVASPFADPALSRIIGRCFV